MQLKRNCTPYPIQLRRAHGTNVGRILVGSLKEGEEFTQPHPLRGAIGSSITYLRSGFIAMHPELSTLP